MNVELMKALEQIEEEKGISKEVIIEAIEAALLSAYKKNYGASAQNMRIEAERNTGAKRELVYKECRDREGDIVTGTVQRIERKNVYLDLGRIEAVLPPTEQIPRESYRQSERIKAYVVEARQGTRGPQIVVP